MGLIKAAIGATSGVLGDQWKEFFYCESIDKDVLVTKGMKRTSKRSSNKHGSSNVISNGSTIAVADGQCMIIVEQGKVVDLCAEPGEYTYKTDLAPSLFTGDLMGNIKEVYADIGKRFTYGGEAPQDQRIYYFNTKELIGNRYGTPSAVPFRVVDEKIGLDIDIAIRCFGEYSYRVTNPILFYANVCGNVTNDYKREELDSTLKSELLTALQPAFAKLSEMGIRYSALPGHTLELSDALNDVLSKKWKDLRGIEIVSFGVNSVKASEEDEDLIKQAQRNAMYRNKDMAAATLIGAQAQAMQDAANNTGGAAIGFMGMNMAQGAGGVNANQLFQQADMQRQQQMQAQQMQAQQAPTGWSCDCGTTNNQGKFCRNCGQPKPLPQGSWKCQCGTIVSGKFCPECGSKKVEETSASQWKCESCGHMNSGKFCNECGSKKPTRKHYKCDKCGYEPSNQEHPPKFCPECGDVFNEYDIES